MFGWLRERNRQKNRQKALARITVIAAQMLRQGERFGIPLEYFEKQEEVQRLIVRLTKAIGGPVRASGHMGILTIYPDLETDGSEFGMGVKEI